MEQKTNKHDHSCDGMCWSAHHFSVVRFLILILIIVFVFTLGAKFGEMYVEVQGSYGHNDMNGMGMQYGHGYLNGYDNYDRMNGGVMSEGMNPGGPMMPVSAPTAGASSTQ